MKTQTSSHKQTCIIRGKEYNNIVTHNVKVNGVTYPNIRFIDWSGKRTLKKVKQSFSVRKEYNKFNEFFGTRQINLQEYQSEVLLCALEPQYVQRKNGVTKFPHKSHVHCSADLYDTKTGNWVQVKSSLKKDDQTSYSPSSYFDELLFMEFHLEDPQNITVDVYHITEVNGVPIYDYIFNQVMVNKNQTFGDQARQGRRPRFSVKKQLIEKFGFKPVTYTI